MHSGGTNKEVGGHRGLGVAALTNSCVEISAKVQLTSCDQLSWWRAEESRKPSTA